MTLKPMSDEELDLLCEKALFSRVSYQQLARSVEQHHGIGIPSPAWCASVDAELAAHAEADAACSVCDAPKCMARGCDGQCNSAWSPAEIRQQAAAYRTLRDVPNHLLGAPRVPCIALPHGLQKGVYLNGVDADKAVGLKCLTCGGHGMIGGPSFSDPGEGGQPCPDCNAPALPAFAQELAAFGALLDSNSLEQGDAS